MTSQPDASAANADDSSCAQDRPRSAEEWLAERGITRQPITVDPGQDTSDASGGGRGDKAPLPPSPGPPPSAREAAQLATEPPAAVPGEGVDPVSGSPAAPETREQSATPPGDLGDEVARALAFIQQSTAQTPASSGRLRRKLNGRDIPAAAVGIALQQAEERGLVDDATLAGVLADEGRAKGHAPKRIRADLRRREFDDDVIATALARHNDRDPEAVAFGVAQRKASSYRGLETEKAFRRLVGYLARRGHNEHIARKVARQVIFDGREDDRVAGH